MSGQGGSRRATLLQVGISLLLGTLLCYVAMRDWQWGDILDTLQPLDGQGMRLAVAAAELPAEGCRLQLLQDGHPLQELACPALPVRSPDDGLRLFTLDAPATLAGDYTLRALPGERPLRRWGLDLRGEVRRQAEGRPLLLADLPAAEGRPPTANRHADPLLFPAVADGQGGTAALVRTVSWIWLGPYVLIFLAIHLLRIVRWGILLRPLGHIPFGRLFAVSTVGFMAILIFPLRLGEFIRPFLVSREASIRMTSALATCLVERVVDGLAVVLILFLMLALLPPETAPVAVRQGGYLAGALFLGVLAALAAFRWQRAWMLRLLEGTVGRLAPGLARKLSGLLSSFLDGLHTLPSLRAVGLFLLLTAVYWLLIGLGYWTIFPTVGITLPSGAEPNLLVAMTIMVILAIGIILPGGPAFAGNFEISLSLGLSLFLAPGMLATRGAAYILLVHSLQFLLQVALGLAFLVGGRVSLRRIVQESRRAAAPEG
ncbi:MAG: lysylphosphatidylglycerol synthase transmembrane domain-containing protein [Myxococcota bacterium]|jgi:uncharacterized protein (TIRG00374 family)|nr:lysylphosphatidylglycerol synthase transmembrane domain-containing protein [Myxococcota bacterium]